MTEFERQVRKQLASDDWIEDVRVEPMHDSDGDPALRVTVVVRSGERLDKERVHCTRMLVRLAALRANEDRWPYVGFDEARDPAALVRWREIVDAK